MTATRSKKDSKQLMIGLLHSQESISYYMKDIIDWSKTQPNIQITHCITHQDPGTNGSSDEPYGIMRGIRSLLKNGLRKSCANFLFLLIHSLERHFLKKKDIYKNHFTLIKLEDLGLIPIQIKPIVSPSKIAHRFSEQDIKTIKDLNLDLLICFGGPILRGDILHTTRFGIIALHHGDNDFYRGSPPGFWEVYEKNPVTGFIIQQLNEEVDNGWVFQKGLLNTKPYWQFNQAALYTQANYYFKAFLEKLSKTHILPIALPHRPYSKQLYLKPTALECLKYMNYLAHFYFKERYQHGKWHIAFLHQHWSEATLSKGIDFPDIPGVGLADPFLYTKDGANYCFVEEIDLETYKGSIAAYQIFDDHAKRLGTVLKESFSMSYPYLFEYKNSLYMMPETSGNYDIRLYECIEFPLKWKLKHVLMDNIQAVDSVLVPIENDWWLLTNLDHTKTEGYSVEFSIFSAKSPLSDTWKPHPQNPIYINGYCTRNGGFFHLDNQHYRVSQRHGMNIYGESIFINQITELTHTNFQEIPLAHLAPNFKKNIERIHHFHTNGALTVFDYFEKTS